jgi:transposase IS116/IS110/IS902 family protein
MDGRRSPGPVCSNGRPANLRRVSIEEVPHVIGVDLSKSLCEIHAADGAGGVFPIWVPVIATALIAKVGDASQFASARHFAAWLGLVPKGAEWEVR